MNTALLGKIADNTGDRMADLFDRLDDGDLTREEFVAMAVALLGVSRARAVALADLGAAADMTRATGAVVPPLGVQAPTTSVTAVVAAIATREAAQVEGRAQTLAAAQEAHHEALERHGADGWTRVLNAGACELCHDLAADEQGPMPMSADPYHHRGCGCSTRPITTKENA